MDKPQWVAVFDFDGTITPKSFISLFRILENNGGLTDEALTKSHELRSYYLNKLTNGALTKEDEEIWFKKTIDLYVESKLTAGLIERILSHIHIRPQVKECLEFLQTKNIPVAIVSYGIIDFISIVLTNHGLMPLIKEIYSARLIFEADTKTVLGVLNGTIVFPSQKGDCSRQFADAYKVPYEQILAVGDSKGDVTLGHLKENRLAIAKNEEEKQSLEPYMGKVVITENFLPVQKWLEEKVAV